VELRERRRGTTHTVLLEDAAGALRAMRERLLEGLD
jgi:hypothetical protein